MKLRCRLGLHAWEPWNFGSTWRHNVDGTWSPYRVRRCLYCHWPQSQLVDDWREWRTP